MILIEAAAGFGKTCTAYEVLAALLDKQPDRPPLFVELARNRQAPLFRYVLLDEIDRNYPSLKSDLVSTEMSAGKVPLIVDGFDELLRRSIDTQPHDEDTAKLESMLDTIAALLTGSAKVVLTTRRTAIFSAESFQKWMASRSSSFRAVRLVLQEPSIRDWLGSDRAARIEELGVMARALANPVLLAFLRHAGNEEFERYVADPDALVERYFKTLLERELERQDINIDYEGQLRIYRELANSMIAQDIMAESRQVVAALILEKSRNQLEESIRRYSLATRPTVEQLAEKLAGHALLDRVGGA